MPDFQFSRSPFLRNHGVGLALLACPLMACTGDDAEQFTAGLTAGDDFSTESGTDEASASECGNSKVEAGEECDLGASNSATGACTPECQINVCGDGYVNPQFEECDDGNAEDGDHCLTTCKDNVCGDGIVNVGKEACDDGNDVDIDDCKNDCTLGTCGDGKLDAGEQCDDGNRNQNDYCAGCQYATCGDGYKWNGEEECDDGNDSDNDACLNGCIAAACGDGVLWVGEEECDDGDIADNDGCPSSCQLASCGDGFLWTGMEGCDDGNNISDDGCDADCYAEYCLLVTNGPDIDLVGNDWFNACADAPGTLVVVKLQDEQGNVVYESQGPIVGDWTQNQLTSSGDSSIEYNENNHDRLVTLENGDKLFVAGRDANPGVDNYYCNTELGNGYVIVIYPSNANWYINPKMIVTSYNGAYNNTPRKFVNWTEDHEISWNGGSAINSCTLGPGGLQPFAGTFTLRIKP